MFTTKRGTPPNLSTHRRASTPRRGHVRGHRPHHSCSPRTRVPTSSDDGAAPRVSRRDALSQRSASQAVWHTTRAAPAGSWVVGTTEDDEASPATQLRRDRRPDAPQLVMTHLQSWKRCPRRGGRVRAVVRLPSREYGTYVLLRYYPTPSNPADAITYLPASFSPRARVAGCWGRGQTRQARSNERYAPSSCSRGRRTLIFLLQYRTADS